MFSRNYLLIYLLICLKNTFLLTCLLYYLFTSLLIYLLILFRNNYLLTFILTSLLKYLFLFGIYLLTYFLIYLFIYLFVLTCFRILNYLLTYRVIPARMYRSLSINVNFELYTNLLKSNMIIIEYSQTTENSVVRTL